MFRHLVNSLGKFNPVDLWHHPIGDDRTDGLACQCLKRQRGAARHQHPISILSQHRAEQGDLSLVIIDDQNGERRLTHLFCSYHDPQPNGNLPRSSMKPLLIRARQALDEEHFAQALELVAEARHSNDLSVDLLEVEALAHQSLEQIDLAAGCYRKMIALEPAEPLWKVAYADIVIRSSDEVLEAGHEATQYLARAAIEAAQLPELLSEVYFLQGVAASLESDHLTASRLFEMATKASEDNLEAVLELALSCFERGDFDRASRLANSLAAQVDEPALWQLQGMLAERRGDDSTEFFERAHAQQPADFPLPVRVTGVEFEQMIAAALDALPPQARAHLSNVVVTAEDFPSLEHLRDEKVSATTLGFYQGDNVYAVNGAQPENQVSPRIVLFQKNLERQADSRAALAEEVRLTVLHEVGHLMGLSEEDLFERGLD